MSKKGQKFQQYRANVEPNETIERMPDMNKTAPQIMDKMASQIDEMYKRLNNVETLVGEFMPNMIKVSSELSDTVNALRVRFERDETLELIKKVGDNIPNFLELIKMMEVVKGMMTDFMPAVKQIAEEVGETVNSLRECFERDEAIEMLKKVGDNIPTFVQLLSTMEVLKGMAADLFPSTAKITHELGDTINDLRVRFERDETIEIIKKLGDNIPAALEILRKMDHVQGMVKDFLPATDNIVKEILPTVNMLRDALERDDLILILKQVGENLPTFRKLLAFLSTFEKTGNLDLTLDEALSRETEILMQGMLKCAHLTMHQIESNPIQPSTWKLIGSVFDKEVQWGILMMTTLMKNMHNCMLSKTAEQNEKEE
jgi:uncharacterized protein YjgD (DUF1641 family)